MISGKDIVILVLHTIIVCIVGTVLFIATNTRVLLIMTFLVFLTFVQTLIYDGCVLAKFEGPMANGTKIVKATLGMAKSQIQLKDLEKILVGLTLAAYLGKLTVLALTEMAYKVPFQAAVCSGKISGGPLGILI